MAIFLTPWRKPVLEGFWANPKMNLASIYQLLVIMCPFTFVAHEFLSSVSSSSSLNPCFFIRQQNFSLEGYATHPKIMEIHTQRHSIARAKCIVSFF